jgi:hypothetical protein
MVRRREEGAGAVGKKMSIEPGCGNHLPYFRFATVGGGGIPEIVPLGKELAAR